MGAARNRKDDDATPRRPALTRERRQAQLEDMALDVLEERLRDRSASSQEVTMLARSATTRGRLEEQKLQAEIELAAAKQKHLESQEELTNLFKEAIEAMGQYGMEKELDD